MSHTTIAHTYTRNGVYYFARRVPRAVHGAYTKRKIIFSLKTRCPIVAANRVKKLIAKLDDHWFTLRLQTDPDLGGQPDFELVVARLLKGCLGQLLVEGGDLEGLRPSQ